MNIEEINCFKTNDGVIHTSHTKATAYVVNSCCEVVDKLLLDKMPNSRFSRDDIVNIVMMLVGDIDDITKLYNGLGIYLNGN